MIPIPTQRVRFGVPYAQGAHDKRFILSQGITSREWIEIMLTALCCPQQNHPKCTYLGVTTTALLEAARSVPASEELGELKWDYRTEQSLILLMDPGLELAEATLGELHSMLWAWAHAPGGVVLLPFACRLAAFATAFARTYKHWSLLHADWAGGAFADPHELVNLPDYHVARLPWIKTMKGV